MAQEQEQNNRPQQLENARVGYQIATSLWIYEGGLIWSKFNALLVANSIILAAIVVTMTTDSRAVILLGVLAMPPVGILLCALWWFITARSFTYHEYWVGAAREIEEQFLSDAVTTVAHGRHPRSRSLSVEGASYGMIALFVLLYVILFIVGAATHLR